MGASVIAGVNAPPVFEFAEHVLDFMTAAVKGFVELDDGCAV